MTSLARVACEQSFHNSPPPARGASIAGLRGRLSGRQGPQTLFSSSGILKSPPVRVCVAGPRAPASPERILTNKPRLTLSLANALQRRLVAERVFAALHDESKAGVDGLHVLFRL